MKRIATATLALIMMALLLTACGGSGTDHIGKTYKTYWFNFKVTSAQTIDSYAGLEVEDGFKLVDFEIETTNTSGYDLEMYDWDFIVVWGDEEDEDYSDYSYCYDPIDDYMCPSVVELADKETMKEHYIFPVPVGVTNPALCYVEIFEGGDTGEEYYAYVNVD